MRSETFALRFGRGDDVVQTLNVAGFVGLDDGFRASDLGGCEALGFQA